MCRKVMQRIGKYLSFFFEYYKILNYFIMYTNKSQSRHGIRVLNSVSRKKSKTMNYHYKTNTVLSKKLDLPNVPFNGSQLLTLYNIPRVEVKLGKRQVSIAVIIAYHSPNLQNDLNIYWKYNFGSSIPVPIINQVNLSNNPNNIDNGWSVEECLDIQMIATMNPYAKISVIEANSSYDNDLNTAILYATNTLNADIISCSWGCDDTRALISSNNAFVNPMNASQYKCFCVSSGDNNSVSWPSVLSNVISVGGSSLYANTTPIKANARTEYTWGSAGCGYSTSVQKPLYQNTVNNTTYRAIPDISLVANPSTGVRIVANGNWIQLGGTSVSCPLFAGILSIANQIRFNLGKNPLTTVYTPKPAINTQPSSIPLTNIQAFLYKNMFNNGCFMDITQGIDGKYVAKKGYDVATGLGSPNVTQLCNILASQIA